MNSLSQRLLHNNGGFVGSDEAYTMRNGVEPIIKYIPKGSIIWLPFTTKEGWFYKLLTEAGFKCRVSHIADGKDFFTYEPKKKWDIIIGNPPFKNKRLFFERALRFGKPFALIMTNAWLNDTYSKKVFLDADKQMQLLMFDRRMKFTNPDGRPNNKITFSCSYYCCDFLPNNLIVEELKV